MEIIKKQGSCCCRGLFDISESSLHHKDFLINQMRSMKSGKTSKRPREKRYPFSQFILERDLVYFKSHVDQAEAEAEEETVTYLRTERTHSTEDQEVAELPTVEDLDQGGNIVDLEEKEEEIEDIFEIQGSLLVLK